MHLVESAPFMAVFAAQQQIMVNLVKMNNRGASPGVIHFD